MSTISDIADAVALKLNEHEGFETDFEAVRKTLPVLDISKMGNGLYVTVVPRTIEYSVVARTKTSGDYAIDVGVQQRISLEDDSECDSLLALVEQIALFLRGQHLSEEGASFVSVTNDPVVAADHLSKFQVFTSVLTVTYRVIR